MFASQPNKLGCDRTVEERGPLRVIATATPPAEARTKGKSDFGRGKDCAWNQPVLCSPHRLNSPPVRSANRLLQVMDGHL
jgi:hypothetical protein